MLEPRVGFEPTRPFPLRSAFPNQLRFSAALSTLKTLPDPNLTPRLLNRNAPPASPPSFAECPQIVRSRGTRTSNHRRTRPAPRGNDFEGRTWGHFSHNDPSGAANSRPKGDSRRPRGLVATPAFHRPFNRPSPQCRRQPRGSFGSYAPRCKQSYQHRAVSGPLWWGLRQRGVDNSIHNASLSSAASDKPSATTRGWVWRSL